MCHFIFRSLEDGSSCVESTEKNTAFFLNSFRIEVNQPVQTLEQIKYKIG